eukprot:scaffold1105_cov140-Isochrysis_galbana.AAC.11
MKAACTGAPRGPHTPNCPARASYLRIEGDAVSAGGSHYSSPSHRDGRFRAGESTLIPAAPPPMGDGGSTPTVGCWRKSSIASAVTPRSPETAGDSCSLYRCIISPVLWSGGDGATPSAPAPLLSELLAEIGADNAPPPTATRRSVAPRGRLLRSAEGGGSSSPPEAGGGGAAAGASHDLRGEWLMKASHWYCC